MHKLIEGECFDIQKVEAFLSFNTIMGEGQFCCDYPSHLTFCKLDPYVWANISSANYTCAHYFVSAAKYINVCIATLHFYRIENTRHIWTMIRYKTEI